MKLVYEIIKSLLLILGLTWIIVAASIYFASFGKGGCGTAFFISPEGYLVTALHVVGRNNTVLVHTDTAQYAIVVARDVRNDIALLKVLSYTQKHPYLSLTTDYKSGSITIYGYPNTELFNNSLKATIGLGHSGFYLLAGRQKVWADSRVYPGNSGSPIINSKGKVVGMATMGYIFVGWVFGPTAKQIIELTRLTSIQLPILESIETPMEQKVVQICVVDRMTD